MTEPNKPPADELALAGATWRTSTFTSKNECVEVAHLANRVAVRDSKNPGGSALIFSKEAWATFLAGAKRGEFDAS